MPRSSYYQAHKKELAEKQRARRRKQKEARDKARGISLEELAKQRREQQNRDDPFYKFNEG